MRGQLRLKNGVVVREIRVIDFKNALTQLLEDGDRAINQVEGEQWDNALLQGSDLIDGKVDDTVKQAFMTLNACFFSLDKQSGGHVFEKTLSRIEADLNLLCVALIERGHRDCWLYGWQFFIAAQESVKNYEL